MDKSKIENGQPAFQYHKVRRSIEVLPEEFLLMLSKGKKIIHKDLANTINEFGQVYYTCVFDGNKRRWLYCA